MAEWWVLGALTLVNTVMIAHSAKRAWRRWRANGTATPSQACLRDGRPVLYIKIRCPIDPSCADDLMVPAVYTETFDQDAGQSELYFQPDGEMVYMALMEHGMSSHPGQGWDEEVAELG